MSLSNLYNLLAGPRKLAAKKARKSTRRALFFEGLEGRRVLASDVVVSGVDITAITSGVGNVNDQDGGIAEHVTVNAGQSIDVQFSYSVANAQSNAQSNGVVGIFKSGNPVTNPGGYTSLGHQGNGSWTGNTLSVSTTGLTTGDYNIAVWVKVSNSIDGDGDADTAAVYEAHVIGVVSVTSTSTIVVAGDAVYTGTAYTASSSITVTTTPAPAGTTLLTYHDDVHNIDLGTTAPVNAGIYTVTATFTPTDTVNYSGSAGSDTFTIAKANASVTATNYSGVYDAASHTASVVIKGVGGVILASNSITGTHVSESGTAQASISSLANYNDATGTATLTITKATATVSVTNYSGAYDGLSHTASVTVTGVGGESATNSITGTDVADSGSVSAALSNPGDYSNAVSGTATLTINKATATVTPTNYSGTYDALSHTASVVIKGVGGGILASNSITGTHVSESGSATAFISGLPNYNDASGTATLTINQATAAVSITNYSGAYDGLSHTASVTVTGVGGESATNSITGTDVADSGSVSAALSNPGDYSTPVSGTATLNITKAAATVVVTGYTGGTYDGVEHTQTVTVTGVGGEQDVLYTTELSGTEAGSYSLAWEYTNANYDDVSDTLAFDIAKAKATVTPTNYSGTYDAASHTASVVITGVGSDGVLASASKTGKHVSESGPVTAAIVGLTNYEDISGTANLTITKAAATVNVTNYSGTYDGNAHTASVMVTGVGGESASASKTGTNVADSGPVSAALSNPGDYGAPSSGTGNLTISNATSTTTVSVADHNLLDNGFVYDGTAYAATATVTGAGVVTGSATLEYFNATTGASLGATAPKNVGTYKVVATYAGDSNHTGSSATTCFAITAKSLDEFTTGSMQAALDLSKQGTVSFALKVGGIAEGDSLVSAFDGATFTLKMVKTPATNTTAAIYETVQFSSTATVVDGVVYVNINLKGNTTFYNFLAQGLDGGEVSASTSNWEMINLSATSNGGNYTLSEDVLTRIFKSTK